MKLRLRFFAAVLCTAALSITASPQKSTLSQDGQIQVQTPPDDDVKLPNGKSQREEILKAEKKQNIKDAADLVALTQQLQQDLEKNESYVFSINTLKKTDDIEKLVKKIRGRMLHN